MGGRGRSRGEPERVEQPASRHAPAAGHPSGVRGQLALLQRAIGSAATARLLQRRVDPALVTDRDGAGLHKYTDPKRGPREVRSGGLFGTGISEKIPRGEIIEVNTDRAVGQHIWAKRNGLEGYVKRDHVTIGEPLAGTNLFIFPSAAGFFLIYDREKGAYLDKAVEDQYRQAFKDSVKHVTDAETAQGVAVRDKAGMVQKIIDGLHMQEMKLEPDPAVWQMAAANIATVKARAQRDKAELVNAGLITNTHQLKDVEFSGADFHKHGQAPFFLRFEQPGAVDIRKIVYKPADLRLDKQLFGSGNTTPSAAQALDLGAASGAADKTTPLISQYKIVDRQDATTQQRYGYMEFVKSDVPHTDVELLDVYRSIAANAAVAYVIGLEDIHQENVLLKRNRIQIIDMEATTGMFQKGRKPGTTTLEPNLRGFIDQQWNKAISQDDGIKGKLFKAIQDGDLTNAPLSAAVSASMLAEFTAVLTKAAAGAFDQAFAAQTAALGGTRARVVPVATKDFYKLIPAAKQATDLTAWKAKLVSDPSLIQTAQGSGGQPRDPLLVKNILESPGTYNSLHRGEIPYFSRDLGTQRMDDEEGNQVVVPPNTFGKIGDAIGTEMDRRRLEYAAGPAQSDAVKIFQQQIIRMTVDVNDELRRRLNLP